MFSTTTKMFTDSGKAKVQDGLLLSEHTLANIKDQNLFKEGYNTKHLWVKNGPLTSGIAHKISEFLPDIKSNIIAEDTAVEQIDWPELKIEESNSSFGKEFLKVVPECQMPELDLR